MLRRSTTTLEPPDERGVGVRLALLDAFELTVDGVTVPLPLSAQRLLAFLALHDHPLRRLYVAGVLWTDAPEDRALANLRSALWRLQAAGCEPVEATPRDLRVARGVRVDFREAATFAQALLAGSTDPDDLDADWRALGGELLPDWYDEWVTDERERFRQLRLHALEVMAERLAGSERWGDAVLAALAAVSADPLRESAHRAVIKVHLAEGNVAEAIRQLHRCERLMIDEVGVPPSPSLAELIRAGTP